MLAEAQFASTFSGAFLTPLAVLITFAVLGGVVRLVVKMNVALDEISKVKKEVLPNGGASLRDSINRIEAEQVEVKRKLKQHLKSSAEKRVEMDRMYADWQQRQPV